MTPCTRHHAAHTTSRALLGISTFQQPPRQPPNGILPRIALTQRDSKSLQRRVEIDPMTRACCLRAGVEASGKRAEEGFVARLGEEAEQGGVKLIAFAAVSSSA
jgi:hypothetical protein